MQLTVLGCNGTYPTPDAPTSGYLFESAHAKVWVDCGYGTFAQLQRLMDPGDLTAIIVSHQHADHTADLLPFAYQRTYGTELDSITVYAPAAVPERLGGFVGKAGGGVFQALDFVAVDGGSTITIADIDVEFATTNHPVPTVAPRLTAGGKSVAYTADTGLQDDLARWAKGADVFLCEASYQGPTDEKVWEHHLTASEAGQLAAEADVNHLVLTHIWPTSDTSVSVAEAKAFFDGLVSVAEPNLVINP